MLDIAKLRSTTPGIAHTVQFNHASSSPMPGTVFSAMNRHLQNELQFGSTEAGLAVGGEIEEIRGNVGRLIGADTDEIAFTGGNSDSWGRAFAALRLKPGDRVLVARSEWGGNLACMQRAGLAIEVMPVDEHGQVDVAELEKRLDPTIQLISVTWGPSNGGLIQPAAAIGQLARSAGIPFFLDAAQLVGQYPIDVKHIQSDVLTAPARKHLRGPRGIGMIYVRRDFQEKLDPVFVDALSAPIVQNQPMLRSDARRFESWEAAPALRLGLGAAIKLALDLSPEAIRAAVKERADQTRHELTKLPFVTLQDLGIERSGLVSFTVEGLTPGEVHSALKAAGINIGLNGSAYTPLDMAARGLTEVLRASVSYLTTEAEIGRLTQALAALRP